MMIDDTYYVSVNGTSPMSKVYIIVPAPHRSTFSLHFDLALR